MNQIPPPPADDTPKRLLVAAIYGRVSRPGQATVPEQIRLCRAKAAQIPARVQFILKDEGLRAQDLTRPGLQRLLRLAEERRFNVLVVWKLDRFVRSLTDLLQAYRYFERLGVDIVSVTEPFDTTNPFGRFSFRGIASAAELERDLISERVQLGRQRQASEGKWPSSRPPLGYRIGADGRLEVNQDETTLVKRIFRSYARGMAITDLTLRLGREGVLSRRGKPFSPSTIHSLITNPIYRGTETIMGIVRTRPDLRLIDSRTAKRIDDRAGKRLPSNMKRALREQAIDNVFSAYQEFHGGPDEGTTEFPGPAQHPRHPERATKRGRSPPRHRIHPSASAAPLTRGVPSASSMTPGEATDAPATRA